MGGLTTRAAKQNTLLLKNIALHLRPRLIYDKVAASVSPY